MTIAASSSCDSFYPLPVRGQSVAPPLRGPMPLAIRIATPDDHAAIKQLVITAFEPITWQKKLDAPFGPLNGCDWKARWHDRLTKIFNTQIILVAELHAGLAAVATATIDQPAAVGFIDVLAVGAEFQGQGLGREMLR